MVKITLDTALTKHQMSRYELAKRTGIQYHIIDKYFKNKVVRYDSFVLDRICTVLDCRIEDLLTFRKN